MTRRYASQILLPILARGIGNDHVRQLSRQFGPQGTSQCRHFWGSRTTDAGVPQDPELQSRFLRDLNNRSEGGGRSKEAVVQLFESGNIKMTEANLCEYIRALAGLDKLSGSALIRTLERGAIASGAGDGSSRSDGASTAGILGSEDRPLYMRTVDKSAYEHMWATIRSLLVTFCLLWGIAWVLEDSSLLRKPAGFLHNPDLKPQRPTDTKFEDVKGVDEAKEELVEVVDYLKSPGQFTKLGGKLPKGILLVGPPGTGKTMLARAIAGEAGVPFFYTSGSEFEEVYVGVGARRVRDLFATAKANAPCIIFIDEIDAVGGSRNPKDQLYQKMTLNQMLVELDGFKPTEGVIVVAATNFPESLDKALVRPGRFDRHVVVPNPDVKGRQAILESCFSKVQMQKNVNLEVIARGTPGFSGADLANLVNVAALKAARDKAPGVTQAAIEYAKDRIMMGAERKSAFITEESRKLTAYHEGGHALVAMLTKGASPVHKATIMPRGNALGMVMQLPDKDDKSMTRRQLLAMLDVCMGGRVAEEIIFGGDDVTTGASQDLTSATRIARAMVTEYGFSDRIGPQHLMYEENSLSPGTRAMVEEEVQLLVQDAYKRAKNLIKANEDKLHKLASALVERETMSGDQISELLGLPLRKS
eukprot:jgi/Ulvmu1/7097/UM033_0158.1